MQVTNSVRETAIATARLTVSLPPRNAVVSGYVQLCRRPARRHCFVSTRTVCQTHKGCVRTDRVEVLTAPGRRVAVTNLKGQTERQDDKTRYAFSALKRNSIKPPRQVKFQLRVNPTGEES